MFLDLPDVEQRNRALRPTLLLADAAARTRFRDDRKTRSKT
jgi:hypothetical protein